MLDRALIRHYLSAANVYILASRHQEFLDAAIEAMIWITHHRNRTDAPSTSDILKNNEASGGLVVPRGDATAIASALEHELTHEEQSRALGTCARRRV